MSTTKIGLPASKRLVRFHLVEAIGDPTIADAICDRLVHNAHEVALSGPSMRKKKAASIPPKH
jgi:hypothetical protein